MTGLGNLHNNRMCNKKCNLSDFIKFFPLDVHRKEYKLRKLVIFKMPWNKEKYEFLALTRDKRIVSYIENLESSVKIKSKKDREFIDQIEEIIYERISRIRRLYVLLGIFYFGIYFSLFSLFFSNLFIISEIADVVSKIASFFGTTAFIIGVFVVSRLIELYFQDLNLLTAHLIAVYNSNGLYEEDLFVNRNQYENFISFFKRRGF